MLEKLKVLIVDDEQIVSNFMRMRLAAEAPHFEIAYVENGFECLEYLKDAEADCILSDYQMPGMDGMELLKKLRAGGRETPFIFITGQGNQEVASEAFKEGASDYFTKDIGFAHFPRIVNSVERAVMNRREQESRERAEAALRAEKSKLESILAGMGGGICITSRNLAEEARRESESEFRSLVESSLVGVYIIKDRCVIYSNPHFRKMLGYTEKELSDIDIARLIHPDELPKVREQYRRCISGEVETVNYQSRWLRKGGSVMDVEVFGTIIEYQGSQAVFGEILDITERRRAETALKESERRLREMLENVKLLAVMLDSSGRVIFCNDFLLELTGWSKEELIGRDWFDVCLPPDSREAIKGYFHDFLENKLVSSHENSIVTQGGRERFIRWNNSVLRDEKGRVIGTTSIGEDVTERKIAETRLSESEAKFRSLVEMTFVGVYLVQGRFVYVNPQMEAMTGYSRDELLGFDDPFVLIHPSERVAAWDDFNKLYTGEKKLRRYQLRWVKKDGSEIFVEGISSATSYNGKPAVIGSVVDITERKKSEDALKASEQRYKDLVELSMDFIYRTDQEGKFTYINESAFKALEYDLDEILEKPCDNLIHPEDRERTVRTLQKMIDEEVDFFSSENRLISKSGKVLNVLHNVRVLRDEKGNVTGTQGIARDIMTLKRAEEERSAMFHMLTHDIRSPLSVIYGYGSLASQLKGEEAEEAIADIQKAARKIYKMIDDILALSRLESDECEFILSAAAITDIIGQALKENEAAAAEKEIRINVDVARGLPRIYCDTTQVERAIGNIISNAINYNQQGGLVEIHSGLSNTREFFIDISDSGPGIDEEDMPRIFDKYYRGRESRKKKGTGLGLAIVKAVVEAHGGRVDVKSARGQGSTFTIILPVKPGL